MTAYVGKKRFTQVKYMQQSRPVDHIIANYTMSSITGCKTHPEMSFNVTIQYESCNAIQCDHVYQWLREDLSLSCDYKHFKDFNAIMHGEPRKNMEHYAKLCTRKLAITTNPCKCVFFIHCIIYANIDVK